ncbi:MAG: phosphate regulon sensor histidine kinase PhoR [Burkholderiaceae bacterium]|nr:phosphate regulon sensor histidine kinase PhoR [Burkholderiaceae bacterium]
MADPDSPNMPQIPGELGELTHRIERALKARDRKVLREQERLTQLLSAIEASPNGMLLLDGHDQVQWINQRAAEHFALDPQRDLEQRITNLVRAPAFVSYLQSGDFEQSLSFTSPSGDILLSVIVRRFGDDMKLVLSQDITERERNDSMRRDFVANVSHEIRSPLTVLIGFLETMTELPLTVAERARVLVLMRQQTHRMQSLVTDLLTLAQIEAAPRPLVDAWIDVPLLVKRIESDARALDGAKHELHFNVEANAEIGGIESELFSAVWNLVSNALRYTPTGGEVHLTWRVLPDGFGEFIVTDTGVGTAKEHIPCLTERFYRVDGSRSRETGGTGLGLAIVKHVVQRHGGQLEISSMPGKGSEFRLLLPVHRTRLFVPRPSPLALAAQAGTCEPLTR